MPTKDIMPAKDIMPTRTMPIIKITAADSTPTEDTVAIEAHYDVKINGCPAFSFTCTPTDLAEMVTGALYSRSYIHSAAQIAAIEISDDLISVTLHPTGADPTPSRRPDIHLQPGEIFRTLSTIFNDPDTLFYRTGCAHSCSLLHGGSIICTYEDIGRHNALDKAIGHALRHAIPTAECAVFTSGRISGDYMAKLIHAGIPIAVSRAAVTTEAIRLAAAHGVTLYGFARGNTANLYNA